MMILRMRCRSQFILLSCFSMLTIFFGCMALRNFSVGHIKNAPQNGILYNSFEEALQARHEADPNTGSKSILLVSVDSGFVEFAFNLWETSFLQHDINKFLFVCTDMKACIDLQKHGLACVKGHGDEDADKPSSFRSDAFNRKTFLKIIITLQALQLGYTVLLVDADIVFLKNPYPYFRCEDCDLIIQSDGRSRKGNTGFFHVRPTFASIQLFEEVMRASKQFKDEQDCMNSVLSLMGKKKTITCSVLPVEEFPTGLNYFTKGRRVFDNQPPCAKCVIIHNNWIVGAAAKIYRFKENLMWLVDTDGYYSNPDAKYLSYNNPSDFGLDSTIDMEMKALGNALYLAHLLNRTVILPEFHCYRCKKCCDYNNHTSLVAHVNMAEFDTQFGHGYREHMFLHHPKVPESVRSSQSPVIHIRSNFTVVEHHQDTMENDTSPSDEKSTSLKDIYSEKSSEILRWLEPFQNISVLRFHSLYGVFKNPTIQNDSVSFQNRLRSALI